MRKSITSRNCAHFLKWRPPAQFYMNKSLRRLILLDGCMARVGPGSVKLKHEVQRQYFYWLLWPYILFIFRVCAQLIQKYYAFGFLPPFESWYSGALSYQWLLISQIVIIALLTLVMRNFYRGQVREKYGMGIFLMVSGASYFSLMVFRLIAGLTFAGHHPWLGAKIPAIFHIVLASFVLIAGHFHYKFGRRRNAYE